jgi:glycogen phosphorylase
LSDPARLARILNDPVRPVQIIFAGQAHPRDDAGKELIRQIVTLCRQPKFRRRMVFLEGYDMAIARSMVQGSDVWLSTPRRPLEASGTSGMKAAANGALNISTLDGWWDEAWHGPEYLADNNSDDFELQSNSIGWAIGRGEDYDDPSYQDRVEAEALYDLLERDVIPTFYERGSDKLPRKWIARMKSSIGHLCYFFNTHRMVKEYTDRFYVPASLRHQRLTADEMARAKALAAWKEHVHRHWPEIRVESVATGPLAGLEVGKAVRVQAQIRLGALAPDDVIVELYAGLIDAGGEIQQALIYPMQPAGSDGNGTYRFEVDSVACRQSGLHGFTVRVLPHHADLPTSFLPGLIVWAGPDVKVR